VEDRVLRSFKAGELDPFGCPYVDPVPYLPSNFRSAKPITQMWTRFPTFGSNRAQAAERKQMPDDLIVTTKADLGERLCVMASPETAAFGGGQVGPLHEDLTGLGELSRYPGLRVVARPEDCRRAPAPP
jgi:hypothetical protein